MGSAADNMKNIKEPELLVLVREIADRARRTETRVTKVANHLGVDAGGDKPYIRGNTLYVPSLKTSLEDIVATIKGTNEFKLEGEVRPFSVQCGEDYIATVRV